MALAAACSSATAPEIHTLFVAPELVDCVGLGPRTCLQVREDPAQPWENFFSPIEGFTFEPGFSYELRVERHVVSPVPADGSSYRYVLLEIVSNTPAGG